MPKNILVFADGTGQQGGLRPDQLLSNVYKLYRATRVGPENCIDPAKQVAFYDPGLGTTTSAGFVRLGWVQRVREWVGLAAGLGISRNVTDCYEAIIKHYEPGDRIYLFGFSRGAYTARSVAGVLSLCGVPSHDNEGRPLKRFGRTLRTIAREAVSGVYDHGAGKPRDKFADDREELGRRFRLKYGSDVAGSSNVVPYFIGVFDAVGALGLPKIARIALILVGAAVAALTSWPTANWLMASKDASFVATYLATLMLILGVPIVGYLMATFKEIRDFPNQGDYRTHHARWHSKNYDVSLDDRVAVVRHALAIDETRRSFGRVEWGSKRTEWVQARDELRPFEQLWFAGNHSDVGGSYAEDESRLSDISLNWMYQEARSARFPILVDEAKFNLYPDSGGVQHCQVQQFREIYPLWWPLRWRWSWPTARRYIPDDAPLHPSVVRRFECGEIFECGVRQPYRPEALRNHDWVSKFYDTPRA